MGLPNVIQLECHLTPDGRRGWTHHLMLCGSSAEGGGMPGGLPLALPVLSVLHFNLAPFSPQCRSPRLLMTPWRSQPARRSSAVPVGMCARVRCCACRTSTSILGASCAKVSVYLALWLATECSKLGFPATLLSLSGSRKLSGHT